MTNKCTSSAGCFDGLCGAPQQYRRHHPMQHVQGYSGSHWTPPLGDYLLCIASVAARATANKTTTKNVPKRLAILMAAAVRGYNNAHISQWKRFRALLEATKCCHRESIAANRHNRSHMCRFFTSFFVDNLYPVSAPLHPCVFGWLLHFYLSFVSRLRPRRVLFSSFFKSNLLPQMTLNRCPHTFHCGCVLSLTPPPHQQCFLVGCCVFNLFAAIQTPGPITLSILIFLLLV